MDTGSISAKERNRLAELETTIAACRDRERESVFEAGKALIEIRDSKLYREDFETFESYCQCKWHWSSRHAYRVCDATEFREGQLLLAALGEPVSIPENEHQARATNRSQSDSSKPKNKRNSSKPVSAKLDISVPIEYSKPPQLPMDIRVIVDTLAKQMDKVLHRSDLPYEMLKEVQIWLREVEQARQLLQGVLPGFEEQVSKPKFKKPLLAVVQVFCQENDIPARDGEWFWNKMEGNGWKNAGKPVADWGRTLIAWKLAGHLPSQKNFVNGEKPKSIARQDWEKLQKRVLNGND